MNNAVMRFDGIHLSHNPKALRVQRRQTVRSERLLSGGAAETVSIEPEIISGTAELFGESCLSDYEKLEQLCRSGRAAALSAPFLGAFSAVLTEITLAAEPREDYIAVSFTFKATANGSHQEPKHGPYCYPDFGETYWDIADRFGTTVEELVALNPQIRSITFLTGRERVRLY